MGYGNKHRAHENSVGSGTDHDGRSSQSLTPRSTSGGLLAIREAMVTLDPKQRLALALFLVQRTDGQQIARMIGTSARSTDQALERGRRRLREKLMSTPTVGHNSQPYRLGRSRPACRLRQGPALLKA
jgi:DNA-directed RNA polymerase specialized sigma24 family protein